MRPTALCLSLLPALAACNTTHQSAADGAQDAYAVPAPGIDPAELDTTVRPQDDFWRYVNGKWIDRTEIPADKAGWGSFAMLGEKSNHDVREIIEDLAAADDLAPDSSDALVRNLYRSYMDTERLNRLGAGPIVGELRAIAGVATKEELGALWGRLGRKNIDLPLGAFVGQDSKNPTQYTVFLSQNGLGLPDRDYYFREGEQADAVRAAYRTYITRLLELGGDADPAGTAARAYAVEEALAKEQWTNVQNRDSEKTYNKMSADAVRASASALPWQEFLGAASLGDVPEFVVRQPSYLEGLGRVFAATSLDDWKAYQTVRVLDHASAYLSDDFYAARFAFYNRTLYGQETPSERWKRGVSLVNRQLGQAVGREYVKRHFPPAAKARMEELVGNLRAALRDNLEHCEWMTDATRAQALDKLAKFTPKIGYPDQWRDYSGLVLREDDLIGNLDRIEAFDYDYQLGKLGGPVRRWEWFMSPQTVNAYYNPRMNEIVFPAAILQAPFFDLAADDAVNYGGIGAVIGHEMGHGFDDQGRKSDGDGMLRNWWTDADAAEYDARAARLGAQYEQFFPLPDLHINGALTMGENIGDLNGVTLAWRAYKRSLGSREAPVIDGLTGDQRFFINFAQIWRSKARDAMLRQQVQTNPHSPAEFRLTGSLMNFTPFYETFGVQKGDKMWRDPADRVTFF